MQYQQGNGGGNGTSQFTTFKQLSPNSCNQQTEKSVFTHTSEMPRQPTVHSHFNYAPANQQANRYFQQQNQTYHQSSGANYETTNRQQSDNRYPLELSSGRKTPSQHQHTQHQEGSNGPNRTSQLLPNEKPLFTYTSQVPHQSTTTNHFNYVPPSQQENRNLQQHNQIYQQSMMVNHQTGNTQHSLNRQSIPAGLNNGPNQTSPFKLFPQNPSNEKSVHSCTVQVSHQSTVMSHFTYSPIIQQENRNVQQQNQLCHQTGCTQQSHNRNPIASSLASGKINSLSQNQPIQHQQNSAHNQTSPFLPFKYLPPNSQNQSNGKPGVTCTSEVHHPPTVVSHVGFTPASQQENMNLQQNQMYHQFNIVSHQTGNMQQSPNRHLTSSGLNNRTAPNQNQLSQGYQNNNGPNQTSPLPLSSSQPSDKPLFALKISHQSDMSHFSYTPTSQQENRNLQQSTQPFYQTGDIQQSHDRHAIPSGLNNGTITTHSQNQHVPHHQNNNGPNQVTQFSTFNQLSQNSHDKPQLRSIPQMPQQSINISQFNHAPTDRHQQTQLYQSSSSVNHQIGNIQQSHSIQPVLSGGANITSPICNNSQNQPQYRPVIPSNAQINVPLKEPMVQTASLQFGSSNLANSFPPVMYTQHQFGSYQTLGNVAEVSSDMKVKSQGQVDSEWVSQWLATREMGKLSEAKTRAPVLIPEVRRVFHQALAYFKVLSRVRDNLKSCVNEDEEVWENKFKQAMSIKHKLNVIMEKLLQPSLCQQLQSKLRKIKKKRELQRRRHEERKMQRLEQNKKRLQIHRCLDSYMETEKEKVLQAKREEEMKKEADNILSEVRRKLQEGKREQERLRVIEKLRQARKDTAQKRGLHISEEADDQFNKKISLLKDIVRKQLIDYDAEEKALKVMLETEQEGQREQEETYRKERQKKLFNKMQKQIKECLFGNNDCIDSSDPLWYYRQYYTQAENNLDALVQTRHQWDIYLVRPNEPCGSSVPVCWIAPDTPSSDSWASVLDVDVNILRK